MEKNAGSSDTTEQLSHRVALGRWGANQWNLPQNDGRVSYCDLPSSLLRTTPGPSKYDPVNGLLLVSCHAWGSGAFCKAVCGFNSPDTPHGRQQSWETASRTHLIWGPLTTLSSLSPPTFPVWRRISTFPTASPRFCLHQWITSFSISNFLCKTPTSSYSSVLNVHGCPLSRIRKYEFPFPLSRKASKLLTMAKKWIKNKAVTFPHENSLNLHIYLAPGHVSLICPFGLRYISLLCPENYISQTSLLAAFWFSQWETMLGDWWADEREKSGYFFPLHSALIGISSVVPGHVRQSIVDSDPTE